MADQATSLPIRSEADGTDERVQTKIVDSSNPDTQQMEVDTDNNAHVEVHGNRADDAADVALLLSEEGRANGRGDYEVDDNSEPNTSGLIAHTRSATHDDTQLLQRPTAVPGESDSICLDISLHDQSGNAYDENNPLFVVAGDDPATEVLDYDTAAAIAKNASDNHDYTVTAATTFKGTRIWATASGKMKIEIQLETAAASGVFNTVYVGFNSTANPNIDIQLDKIPQQVAGAIVRIIRTNLDNQAQDLYSTIAGLES